MTTPSERVLESWRQNAKEEFWLHQLEQYPMRIMNGFGQTIREVPYTGTEVRVATNYWTQVSSIDYAKFERRTNPFTKWYDANRPWCE